MHIVVGVMKKAYAITQQHPVSALLPDGLLTKHEIAQRLRISTRTVDSWMRTKRLPFIKAGKTVRFRWPDVLAHLDQFRIG